MEKSEIREMISELKRAMPDAQKRSEEAQVWVKLEISDEFCKAGTVLAYCSLPDEFSTGEFMEKWLGKKRLVVPLVDGNELKLKEFIPGRLVPGYKGISEPDASLPDINPGEVDFAIIPGVAFTLAGARLGRGKGFYDRLLPLLNCPTAGLAWSCQIVEDIPTVSRDVNVSLVYSSSGPFIVERQA